MHGGDWLAARLAVGAVVLVASAAHGVSISVSSTSAMPGDRVAIAVTLATDGAAVLATQNRIDFTRSAFVAATDVGEPDCAVNQAIGKEASAFRFLPLGCDPNHDCTSVRAFVLSFQNLTPIDDGAVLYTCGVQVAVDAPAGVYPLGIEERGASAPGGTFLPADGVAGAVEVTLLPAARLTAGEASGRAGDTVQVDVSFDLLGNAQVVGVQNDLAFDAATPIAATAETAPACRVNPAINKEGTAFVFLPVGCTPGADCNGVRAFVFSLTNVDPLSDDVSLYHCDVAIAAAAVPGTYPVVVSMAAASGPQAESLPVVTADGRVLVDEPPPPPVCPGDCDGDRRVDIGELLTGVNLVINGAPPESCVALDTDHSGTPSIAELIQAVNSALIGCPTRQAPVGIVLLAPSQVVW